MTQTTSATPDEPSSPTSVEPSSATPGEPSGLAAAQRPPGGEVWPRGPGFTEPSWAQTPRESALVVLTGLFGLVSLGCALVPDLHVPGAWAGLAGGATGTAAQMLSRSTTQRWATVLGWGAALLGAMLNMSHGGLW